MLCLYTRARTHTHPPCLLPQGIFRKCTVMHYIFRMATYRDSTSMSTNRLTLLLVGHSFVHRMQQQVCWKYKHCYVAVPAGPYKHCCTAVELQTLLCCCICKTLQTLLHCCGITNIAMLLYLQDFTNIAALLWNYKYCCTCNNCYSIYLQDLTNIVTLCLHGFMNIYTIYLHEHQYGYILNIIFHEIMTVAAIFGWNVIK